MARKITLTKEWDSERLCYFIFLKVDGVFVKVFSEFEENQAKTFFNNYGRIEPDPDKLNILISEKEI